MTISLIGAMDRNRGIGFEGNIPWIVNGKNNVPADMQRFRALTLSHTIIMGRNTYLSLSRALPGRTNIVLAYEESFRLPDAVVSNSLEAALRDAAELPGGDEVFIIGGGSVFAEALRTEVVARIYLTVIDHEFPADTFFPTNVLGNAKWNTTEDISIPADERNQFPLRFLTLEKV